MTLSWKNESELVNLVVRRLYPYCMLYRVNAGTVKMQNGGYFSTGVPAGYSDLSGYRRTDGKAVFIECKVRPNKASPKQLEFIAKAKEAGCIAGVCYSPEEALELVMGFAEMGEVDGQTG